MDSVHIFCAHFIHVCVSRTDVVANSHLRRSEEEELPEVTSLEITGSHITGNDRTGDRKCLLRMHNRFMRFFLTIVVVQHVPLRMTGSNMATGCDPEGVSLKGWGCPPAQQEVAQYPIRRHS